MEYEIGLTGIFLLVLVFLSTIESAYTQLSDVALRLLAQESNGNGNSKSRRVRFLRELVDNHQLFSFTVTAGIQLCVISVTILLTHLAWVINNRSWQLNAELLALLTFVVTLLIITLCRQLLPYLFSQNAPESTLLALLPIFEVFYRLGSPAVYPVYKLLQTFKKPVEEKEIKAEEEAQADEIQALIDFGEEEGIIEEEEGEMIQSIVEFADTTVDEVMTPRTAIVAIEASATIKDARDLIIDSKHSRIPVYREQLDNIEGIIYVRDLLVLWREGRDTEPVINLARTAYFVPETKLVADLLEEMQKAKVQIAMVIDEYGGIAGLVTIEDILEEIVGEIEDEDVTEVQPDEIVETGEGAYLVSGNTEIRKIETFFDAELEADDFTTVAGLIINQLGHLPAVGERLKLKGFSFEVTQADGRRVKQVRISPAKPADSSMNGSENVKAAQER